MIAANRLPVYLGITTFGLLGALLLGRPEPALLVVPFALVLVLGLAGAARPVVQGALVVSSERVLEGEQVVAAVTVRSSLAIPRCEIRLQLPAELDPGAPVGFVIALRAGEERTLKWPLSGRRWGAYRLGPVHVRCQDRIGLVSHSLTLPAAAALRVFPSYERLNRSLRPLRTRAWAGNFVSTAKGEGIEYADVTRYGPGDQVRRINWRVSARRSELHVNRAHPERNTDLVLFLDSFSELRVPSGSSLDLAVRGAAALAEHHLARRDRVGLISFGGTLRWLRPQMGSAQLYRIVDSLLDTEVVLSYAWKGVEVLPRQTLPAGALVVAFSPLLDARSLTALVDLRSRGHDLSIVELAPEAYLRPGRREPELLAYRVWVLEREAIRARYQALGIPIVLWHPDRPFQAALEEAAGFRRQARLARG